MANYQTYRKDLRGWVLVVLVLIVVLSFFDFVKVEEEDDDEDEPITPRAAASALDLGAVGVDLQDPPAILSS